MNAMQKLLVGGEWNGREGRALRVRHVETYAWGKENESGRRGLELASWDYDIPEVTDFQRQKQGVTLT